MRVRAAAVLTHLRTLLAVLVVAAAVLAPDPAFAQLGTLLSPGPLARAHANLEGLANCAKCHEQGRKVTAQKCLSCHDPVAQRIARKFGVHKEVTGECVLCHAEHAGVDGELRPFDQKTFDHAAVTGFPLTGRHALGAQQCAACHKGRSFVDLKPACATCHTDVHKPSLGANCATCHSTQSAFKGGAQAFSHATASFRLTGAHARVACASCHVGGVYKGVKSANCTDCHKEPHRPTLGATCTSCHTTDTWRTRTVNHARTAFPLSGGHATVTCESCHVQPATKVRLASDRCASCHADAHRGGFSQDCKSCHTDSSWKGGRFDHGTTTFALTGKHQGPSCEQCHRPGASGVVSLPRTAPATSLRVAPATRGTAARVVDFKGLKAACVSCHADVHQAELGTACESCHSVSSFAIRTYAHKTPGPFFAGQHASLRCEQCHQGLAPAQAAVATSRVPVTPLAARFTKASRACVSCHTDVHLGQFKATCETCHTVETAKFGVTLDHAKQTSFALTGRHAAVVCRECHKSETGRFPAGSGTAVRLKGVGVACASCHADVHLGQLPTTCEQCHATETFHLTKYVHTAKPVLALMTGAHARAACADCHKPSTGRFPAGVGTAIRFTTGTACVSCHTDQHRGALGSKCGNCHRP